jgi:hypothetical protein
MHMRALLLAIVSLGYLPLAFGQDGKELGRNITPAIRIDLEKARERDRKFIRYFSLAHLAEAGLSEAELEKHRIAFTKLINCLSWGRKIIKPSAIDDKQTIYRIDLRDYRWNEKIWNALTASYPYEGIDSLEKEMKYLREVTDCGNPLVRIDWFLAQASKAPLYYEVLQLPDDEKELGKLLQLEIEENINAERVQRVGISKSAVSPHARLLERHETSNGYYWKTYDFEGTPGKGNLLESPLGPTGDGFQHTSSAALFTLPNGLQGYFLMDANGKRIDRSQPGILRDDQQPDRAVVAGISCIRCHHSGLIEKVDEIRELVKKSPRAFPKEELNTVLALHPEQAEMDKILKSDKERYAQALSQLSPGTSDNEKLIDPVSSITQQYDGNVSLKRVAAELATSQEKVLAAMDKNPTLGRTLAPLRLPESKLPRSYFLAALPDLVGELHGESASVSRSTPSTKASTPGMPNVKGKIFARGSQVVYLADLPETDAVAGHTPFMKNGVRLNNARVMLSGYPSSKSLFMIPHSSNRVTSVKYQIGKQAELFKTTIGIDDSEGHIWSPVYFTIVGDGKELYKSDPLTNEVRSREVSVSVAKVEVLELRVSCGGHNGGCHAVWADPRLLQRASSIDVGWPLIAKIFSTGPVTYLADLRMLDPRKGSWPVTINGETGGGQPITVQEKKYPKGIGMHPPDNSFSSVTFNLDKKAAVVKGAVSLDGTSQNSDTPLIFEIHGDGKKLWSSQPINTPTPEEFSVSVSGVEKLELRVVCSGGARGAHAVWLNPRVLQRASSLDGEASLNKKVFTTGPREYLSSLTMTEVKSGPWPVSQNGEVGGGKKIAVQGKEYAKGIGMHPPSQGSSSASFILDKKAAVLKGAASLDDGHGHAWGQAKFEVHGDGKLLWSSRPIQSPKPEEFEVNISGVNKLELRVSCEGNSNGVHAVWLDPRVLQSKNTKDE